MPEQISQKPPTRLTGLIANVHRLATGRELELTDALPYFGDPKRLASVVAQSGVPADPAKRRKLDMLLSESRHGL